MKKKMRKFEEGGLSKAQEEYLGGADRTDPYIMARMRRAVPDEPKAAPAMPKADAGEIRDETGTVSKMRRNTETGELYSTDMSETKIVPKATSSAAPKAEQKLSLRVKLQQQKVDQKLVELGKPPQVYLNFKLKYKLMQNLNKAKPRNHSVHPLPRVSLDKAIQAQVTSKLECKKKPKLDKAKDHLFSKE